MTNWECVDCKRNTLTKPEMFFVDSDSKIKISNRVSICTRCKRVHDENGNEFTINGKKVYRKNTQFVLEA